MLENKFRKVMADAASDSNAVRYIRELRQTHTRIQEFPFHGMVVSIWRSRERTEAPYRVVFGNATTGDKVLFGDYAKMSQWKTELLKMGRVIGEAVSFSAGEE